VGHGDDDGCCYIQLVTLVAHKQVDVAVGVLVAMAVAAADEAH
jgi:hypothetical protein